MTSLEFVSVRTLGAPVTPKKPFAEYLGRERVRYLWPCGHEEVVDHSRIPPHGETEPANHIRARWIGFAWGQNPLMPAHDCPKCAKRRAENRRKRDGARHKRAKKKARQKTSGRVRAS